MLAMRKKLISWRAEWNITRSIWQGLMRWAPNIDIVEEMCMILEPWKFVRVLSV